MNRKHRGLWDNSREYWKDGEAWMGDLKEGDTGMKEQKEGETG